MIPQNPDIHIAVIDDNSVNCDYQNSPGGTVRYSLEWNVLTCWLAVFSQSGVHHTRTFALLSLGILLTKYVLQPFSVSVTLP